MVNCHRTFLLEQLVNDFLPTQSCRWLSHGRYPDTVIRRCPYLRTLFLGKDEQKTVNQSAGNILSGEELGNPLCLRRAYDADAGIADDGRNRIVASAHLQLLAAIGSKQLGDERIVIITVDGIEHAHDFIHRDDDSTLVVVVLFHHRLWGEVRQDGL